MFTSRIGSIVSIHSDSAKSIIGDEVAETKQQGTVIITMLGRHIFDCQLFMTKQFTLQLLLTDSSMKLRNLSVFFSKKGNPSWNF